MSLDGLMIVHYNLLFRQDYSVNDLVNARTPSNLALRDY